MIARPTSRPGNRLRHTGGRHRGPVRGRYPPRRSPRIVVTHPALVGEGPLPATTEQLQRLPWLALRTYYTEEVVLTCQADGRSHRFAIQPRMSTDSLYALRSAALAGLGACVSSAWVVAGTSKKAGWSARAAVASRSPRLPHLPCAQLSRQAAPVRRDHPYGHAQPRRA